MYPNPFCPVQTGESLWAVNADSKVVITPLSSSASAVTQKTVRCCWNESFMWLPPHYNCLSWMAWLGSSHCGKLQLLYFSLFIMWSGEAARSWWGVGLDFCTEGEEKKWFNVFSLVRFQFHLFGSSWCSFWDFVAVGEQRQMQEISIYQTDIYWKLFILDVFLHINCYHLS